MRKAQDLRLRLVVAGLVTCSLLNPAIYAVAQQAQSQQSAQPAPPTARDNAPVPPMPPADPAVFDTSATDDLLPDSPGAVESAQLPQQQAPVSQQPQQAQPAQPVQPQVQQPANPPREPLGTAAAETVPTVGVAASKPAGAALAPAKQRRIRTILIRTGAVIGAAAAVGVTMALTEASPSKPPGAH